MNPEDWRELMQLVYIPGYGFTPAPEPVPDWQTAKIDAACDFWELQLMGIRG